MDFGVIKRVWLPLALCAGTLCWIFSHGPKLRDAWGWVGFSIAAVGIAGVFVSRYTLGKSFSIKAKATALVTNGIYAHIRNPIYVSGCIFLTGAAIMMHKPIILAVLVVLIPMQIWRARNEARVLEEKFGDEYRAYRQRTWF